MAQSSAGWNDDGEDDSQDDPLPMDNSERATTSRSSPNFQLSKPEEAPSTLPDSQPTHVDAKEPAYLPPAAAPSPSPAPMPDVSQAFAQLNDPGVVPAPGYEDTYAQ